MDHFPLNNLFSLSLINLFFFFTAPADCASCYNDSQQNLISPATAWRTVWCGAGDLKKPG